MLENVNEHARECLSKAAECRRLAESTSDQRMRSDFLDMERRWLKLANSYQFADRLSDWLSEAERKRRLEW